jgi:hypothetical protein
VTPNSLPVPETIQIFTIWAFHKIRRYLPQTRNCLVVILKTYLVGYSNNLGVNVMCYRGARSGVAYLTICITICICLLLSIASIGLLVSANGSIPTKGSVPTTQSKPTTQSTPNITMPPVTMPTITIPNVTNETKFTVLPREVVVDVGDTFFVSVFAENVTNMDAWQITLCFNPKIVECINVSLPDQHVFSDRYTTSQALIDYNSTEFTKRPLQSIKYGEGYVLAGDCLWVNQTTFYGSGFLCRVTFKAIAAGSSHLTLCSPEALFQTYYLDDNIESTTPSLFDSTVTVLSK